MYTCIKSCGWSYFTVKMNDTGMKNLINFPCFQDFFLCSTDQINKNKTSVKICFIYKNLLMHAVGEIQKSRTVNELQ